MLRRLPLLACLAAALAGAPGARADSASSLTVLGTSDVSDSGLMQNLIQPQFQAAYPQFAFKYVGTATGTAITSAKTGSQGASVLIVHAPSLENRFVASGYSAEPYGRAIFTNDFVFAGPKADPAGAAGAGAHDVARALAAVAAAGIAGGGSPRVTFVSRGGTPGTTVEEHKVWQLVDRAGLAPSGLLLCAVGAPSGGGEAPIAAGNGVSASGQPCPGAGAPSPSGSALPRWYAATGLTQGPNVVAANTCSFPSGANTCYVLTDRGTFDYLASGSSPAGGSAGIPNLRIVTRGPQDASAPGGANLLVNYFHAYVINPAKPGESVNLPAARDFVDLLTSPALQERLGHYLGGGDVAPFVADASPAITSAGFPATAAAGAPVTVTGTVTNAQPGLAAIDGVPVTLAELVGGLPVPVGSATTDASGHYRITFTPAANGSYQVATGQIAQIELPALDPQFGDLLSPAATAPVTMNLQSAIRALQAGGAAGGVTVLGTVAPAPPDAAARVSVLARRAGSGAAFAPVGGGPLGAGRSAFAVNGSLPAGRWDVEVAYADPGQLLGSTSAVRTVTVPAAGRAVAAGFRRLRLRGGTLTVTGALSRPAGARGATVRLLGSRSGGSLRRLAQRHVAAGRRALTIEVKLQRHRRWALQLAGVDSGHLVLSELRSLAVP